MLFPFFAKSQEIIQMAIDAGESFSVHPEADVSIYSDINNSGSFASYRNSIIVFFGQRWDNRAGSSMPDESSSGINGSGGNFKFSRIVSSPQYINSSNNPRSNSGFPNISLANSQNVILEGSDLMIRNNLNFESGHLILNNRNAIMGVKGSITGYNETKYVVTGTGINGGFLIRSTSGLQQPDIIFPLGTTVSSYTPASVNYAGTGQDLKVRVFDNVYDKAIFGTSDNVNFVTKTWNVVFSNLDPKANMVLKMQHNAAEESPLFAANRTKSFVSRYQSNIGKWDFTASGGISPGVISTSNAIANSYVSTRSVTGGLELTEYFSKSVLKENVPGNYRVLVGISPNNDGLNDKFVVENLKPTDKVRLEIYNRWQTIVFRDSNFKNNFEGTGNQHGLVNDTLPDGTYYYILNFNDSKPITGYIIINR